MVRFRDRRRIQDRRRLAAEKIEFGLLGIRTSPANRRPLYRVDRRLGLSFAAIDLALSDDRFFFLEVNPTGEWAWLQEEVQFPIAAKLAEVLSRTRPTQVAGS